MPYIPQGQREYLDDGSTSPTSAGELNYLITRLCLEYEFAHGAKYTIYNDIVGALECAKLEFYRRLVVPYENQKINDNGDVYRSEVLF